jgi:hypothetical protein
MNKLMRGRVVPTISDNSSCEILSSTGYSDEIATDCDAKRHAFRRKSAVRGVGAKRRWNFVHNLMDLVVASQVIISWFF